MDSVGFPTLIGDVHPVRDTMSRYLPTHFGARFSEKAFGPST